MAAVWPVRGNETIARAIQRNIDAVGMPAWTAEEQDFARALQKAADKPQDGLREAATPLTGPCQPIMASNDCGDVSWVVPMGRVWFPANIPHAAFHHWSAGAALTTSIAHKGSVAGAKALAASALDFLTSPEAVEEAWRTFRVETEGTPYKSLLPAGQKPPRADGAVPACHGAALSQRFTDLRHAESGMIVRPCRAVHRGGMVLARRDETDNVGRRRVLDVPK
jgi:aminobenzoyl-glutamate utilization protein B